MLCPVPGSPSISNQHQEALTGITINYAAQQSNNGQETREITGRISLVD